MGNIAQDCSESKRENSGSSCGTNKSTEVKTIQSEDVENPLHYLLSDTDGEEEVRQVCINDEGSRPQFVRVGVQGVPMNGVVDTGAGITIINGPMFKRVAPVARLKKRDFKAPDKTRGHMLMFRSLLSQMVA